MPNEFVIYRETSRRTFIFFCFFRSFATFYKLSHVVGMDKLKVNFSMGLFVCLDELAKMFQSNSQNSNQILLMSTITKRTFKFPS